MRKISVALAGFAVAFSAIFAVSTPVYAVTEKPCPAGSLQGENVYYLPPDSSEQPTVAPDTNIDANGKLADGTILSSQAQCNMHGKDIRSSDLIVTIDGLINVILAVLGIVAVVVIIIGGVTYVTSSGDPNKVKRAKDTILYGIIGLVIALLAYMIVNFVLDAVLSN